jgi:plasmid stabilization system protein ParE
MKPAISVRVVGSAARSIEDVARWWETNRPKAPDAFLTDLENALQLIASNPDIGVRASNVSLEGVRRVHLTRVRYYLYYRLTREPAIEVLALWHTSRADMPNL